MTAHLSVHKFMRTPSVMLKNNSRNFQFSQNTYAILIMFNIIILFVCVEDFHSVYTKHFIFCASVSFSKSTEVRVHFLMGTPCSTGDWDKNFYHCLPRLFHKLEGLGLPEEASF